MERDKKAYNILVIEDNPGDCQLIEDYLNEQILAPEIIFAGSYIETKRLYLSDTKKFDVVLLDLSLPDKSGEALILEIVTFFSNCPIIVLTGYSDIQFSIKSLSFGISDYLIKDELNAVALYKSIVYNIERKKTMMQLEESEKRYSELFHLSPLPMWVYDCSSLRFLDVNSAAIIHYGYSYDEFLSMTIKEIRATEDIEKLEAAIKDNLKSSQSFFHGIFRHKKKNGELIQVDLRSSKIMFKGNMAKVIVVNDMTERLNYLQAIEEQNQNLHEIAWIQSHEVRAPLARIMGLIDLIKHKKTGEKEKDELLCHILKSAEDFDVVIKKIVTKAEDVRLKILEKNNRTYNP